MTYAEIIAAWNAQADHMNQWPALSEQEKVEWAIRCALEKAAKVCMDKAHKMEREAVDAEKDGDGNRATAWVLAVCSQEILARKDKP